LDRPRGCGCGGGGRGSGSGAASADEHDADEDTLSRDAPQHSARHLPLLCRVVAAAAAWQLLPPPPLLRSLLRPEKSCMADLRVAAPCSLAPALAAPARARASSWREGMQWQQATGN